MVASKGVIASVTAALTLLGTMTMAQAQQKTDAANVILIIGDGMDDSQITIARNYLKGATGKLLLDQMAVRANVNVLTVDEGEPAKQVYVADSANSATAIATGFVTSRGRIGTSAGQDRDLETITEQAKKAGMKVGIITTASVTDATSASFIAHINKRNCENPGMMSNVELHGEWVVDCSQDLKANGGLGSISEQIADSNFDLIFGGGMEHFTPMTEDGRQTVLERAKDNGFRIIQTRDELSPVRGSGRYLGIFAEDTMPVRLRGEGGREAEEAETSFLHIFHRYLGSVTLPEPMICEPNPDFGKTPTLADMTRSALRHLNNENGFFLMVESASIDKQAHGRKACGSIGEVAQLEEALQVALNYAGQRSNTLVLVTADHGQIAQLLPQESMFTEIGVPIYSPGKVSRIRTPEDSIMMINYASNQFDIEEHSGSDVPLFGNRQALGKFPVLIQQQEINAIMKRHLGL